jgi:hypothetical protein
VAGLVAGRDRGGCRVVPLRAAARPRDAKLSCPVLNTAAPAARRPAPKRRIPPEIL